MTEAADLKSFAILAELSEEERELVAELLERLALDDGEQLFAEGQESEGLVLVEEGALLLTSSRAGSLGQLLAGETLGAVSLVSVGAREATAVASGATRISLLSRESFRRLVEDSPRAACRMLEAAILDLAAAVREGLDRLGA